MSVGPAVASLDWQPANGPGGPIAGVPPNELTSSDRSDWLAGTPWHKHVPARIEPVEAS